MFAAWKRSIRRMPWWGQALTWPLYGVAHAILGALGWGAKELGGQARAGAKKVFAPLLWPAAGIALLLVALATIGEQGVAQLVTPIIALGIMLFGLRIMLRSVWPTSGKKKKKRH